MPPGQASDARYRARSMWLDTYPGSLGPRPALEGDTDTDVAIVGGGFTGLWTAYYLRQLDPTLRVTVIERDICGFGASGRNGGWAIGELAAGIQKYAALADLPASLRLARAIFDSVDEIGRVTAAEGSNAATTRAASSAGPATPLRRGAKPPRSPTSTSWASTPTRSGCSAPTRPASTAGPPACSAGSSTPRVRRSIPPGW